MTHSNKIPKNFQCRQQHLRCLLLRCLLLSFVRNQCPVETITEKNTLKRLLFLLQFTFLRSKIIMMVNRLKLFIFMIKCVWKRVFSHEATRSRTCYTHLSPANQKALFYVTYMEFSLFSCTMSVSKRARNGEW